MITIIDYGSGNVEAIANIYKRLNIEHEITSSPETIERAEKLILPGVGTFDQTIGKLNSSGLREILDRKVLQENTPTLGICVGMQIMADSSEEGQEKGLGWISGKVRKFDISKLETKPYLPHMGWNSIDPKVDHKILEGIEKDKGFYFIHTYYFEASSVENILTETNYGGVFTSSVFNNNVFGMQFHPEKSHSNGIRLLKNFAQINI